MLANTTTPHCRFCRRSHWQREGSSLLENEHGHVRPSLGSIVPGYCIVVPWEHSCSLASTRPEVRAGLIRLLRAAQIKIEEIWGPTIIFEHGPAMPGSPVGCSVDHTHLHVVPVPQSTSLRTLTELTWRPTPPLHPQKTFLPTRDDYIYLEEKDGSAWIAIGDIGRQVMRKAVAASQGVPEKFDWRLHPFANNIEATEACWMEAADAR